MENKGNKGLFSVRLEDKNKENKSLAHGVPPPPRCRSLPVPSSPSLRPRSRSKVSAAKLRDAIGERRVIRVSDAVHDPAAIYPLLYTPDLGSTVAPPLPCSKEREHEEDRQRYYVNLGYAIRTLREELPTMFYKEPTFDIYRDDIVFKDPVNTFSGIENYKRIFWALRLNGRIFFKTLWIDTMSIWQPVENVIMVRWTVHGIPRVPWESHGRFDGTSEYKLDKEGKIYEHKVDNVAMNSPPKFRVLPVEELILSLGGCPNTPRPTYFKMLLSSPVIAYMPYLVKFTWVRYYLALHLTLVWKCLADDWRKISTAESFDVYL